MLEKYPGDPGGSSWGNGPDDPNEQLMVGWPEDLFPPVARQLERDGMRDKFDVVVGPHVGFPTREVFEMLVRDDRSGIWNLVMACVRAVYPTWFPDISGAQVKNAHMGCIDLSGARMDNVDMEGATLPFADLAHSRGENLNMAHVKGRRVCLNDVYWHSCDAHRAEFPEASMKGAFLPGIFLMGTNMKWVDLRHAGLPQATITKADFLYARFSNTNFVDVRDAHRAANLDRIRHARPSFTNAATRALLPPGFPAVVGPDPT